MYELIIAEKPQAAAKIAEAIGRPKEKYIGKVTYYEISLDGKQIIVASAVGHLFGLAEKIKGKWDYPVFELMWKPTYEISKSAAFSKKYFLILKKLAAGASSFVNGCDLDMEGEVIFRNILRFICSREDAKRMRFSTLTKEDLVDAYKDASPHIDLGLAEAGETRHWLDYMWGVNTTRALTLALKRAAGGFQILSSGRVQSPTLSLLVERERRIESFIPKPYWQILAKILATDKGIEAMHIKEKIFKEVEAKEIFEKCLHKDAKVEKISERQYKVQPPLPFNITTLQTAAYELFGFSPSQTLEIAESLYLSAFISYPRTSSEKLPSKIGYRSILAALAKLKDFGSAIDILSKKRLKPREGKKSDPAHVAIYPTASPPLSLEKLDERQRKIYSLIVKRFLACFGDAGIKESQDIRFEIGGEIFKTSGVKIINPGWLGLYTPYVQLKEVLLPDLKEGQILKVEKVEIISDKTKPHPRYTQGSVITEMEKRGLGTKATRAEILQTLYDRQYIVGKSIQVTELGKAIISVLEKYSPDLVSEELTKHFEQEMEEVQAQKKTREGVIGEAKGILEKILKKFRTSEEEIGAGLQVASAATRAAAAIVGKCPSCGEDLKIIRSKASGKIFIGCSGYSKGCRTAFPLPQGRVVRPSKLVCSTCNSPIVFVFTKGKRPWRLCINPACPSKQQSQENQKQGQTQQSN